MEKKTLKHSKQRDAFLRTLRRTKAHPTAYWIYEELKKEFPNISLATVYRNLKLALEMAGIDFSGREHDALDDARNTAELLQIFKNETLFDKTLRKIAEVMRPSSLGNTLGNMIDLSMLAFG